MLIQKFTMITLYPFYEKICKEQTNKLIKEKRTTKGVYNIYKCAYFSVSFLWGYYIMKDSFVYPDFLGGSGDVKDLFKDYPFVKFPPGYELYFTGTMGYHLAGCLYHFFGKKLNNDYFEMVLHHLVTLYLYGYSYLTHTIIGGVIAVLHDIADIFVTNTRIWSDSKFTWPLRISFVLLLPIWFYTRMLVFPYIIYTIIVTPVNFASDYIKFYFAFLLSCLCFLHYYWFTLMIKMVINFFTKGIEEDLQNQIVKPPSDTQNQESKETIYKPKKE